MVKNIIGGKKSKNFARKNFISRGVRLSTTPEEIYAQVTKYLGNGMCHVMCADLQTRLCIIRGKFKGRGKRDNKVGVGVWVLVGLRSWASSDSNKINVCDLLEVYDETNKQQLKDKEVSINWGAFTTINTATNTKNDETETFLTFSNDTSKEEYDELMTQKLPPDLDAINDDTGELSSSVLGFSTIDEESDSDVDIDDI